MRKKLMLRLCLILMVALSAYSCRTDQFHESETYNDSSKFQLTSKRISLNESKHKSLLVPELKKAEAAFKNSNTRVNGKVIDYGNGVSIDTDDVIYIENGPNYHTYTFHIKRENAPADAPLENLLLSPLPDGGYKEFLITYNLTALEKEKLQAGLPVNTQGKTQVTELANGTFNGGSQLARQVCTTSSYSYWSSCSGTQHHDGSNYESCPIYQGLEQGTPPINYTIVTTTCLDINDDVITPIDPGGSSGGGGGSTPGGTTPPPNNPPCTGTTIPTNPEPGFTDENGCPIGLPSLPNLPPKNNPCAKIKKITDETTDLKAKIKNLNKTDSLNLNYEKGAVISDDALGNTKLTHKNGTPSTTYIEFVTPETGEVIIFVHSHFDGVNMLPTFTFEDLRAFNAMYQWRKYNNKPLEKLSFYVITKSGVFAMRIDDESLFNTEGYKLFTDQYNSLSKEFYGEITKKVNVTADEVIKQVAKSLPDYGIGLYKATNDNLDSWNKLTVNPTTDQLEEKPCN